jgi:hypothetical protein
MLSAVLPLRYDDALEECAPGYNLDNTSCKPCDKGSYCSGADVPRQSCGIHLTTKSATAVIITACITQPGVAYMTGPAAATPCPFNTYNAGGNRRNCTGGQGRAAQRLQDDVAGPV